MSKSESLTLRLTPRGKPLPHLPAELPINSDASVDELYAAVAKLTGYSAHRVRITKADTSHLKPGATHVGDSGLYDESQLFIKDLGPQISWRLVYFIEYLGPLLFHPLFLIFRRQIYFNYPAWFQWSPNVLTTPITNTQYILCTLITLHFFKRELETLFIHRFSASTMPLSYVFRNSTHYWLLGGLYLGYFIYMPTKSECPDWLFYPSIALWVYAELGNFLAHKTLRDLRKPGTRDRGIPKGYGFNWVSCPNYFFEILAWLAIVGLTGGAVSAIVFAVVGGATMTKWAWAREMRYRKEFGDKYKKKRYAIIPFVV